MLWQHQGEPLKRGTIVYPSKFKRGAKKYLREETEKLPPSPHKLLILKSIPLLPRPTELVLQTFLLSATAKSAPRYKEIMCDSEVYDLIQISGIHSLPLDLLWNRLNKVELGLGQYLKIGDIEKFQYFFWNTAEKDGWNYEEKDNFRQFLSSDKELSIQFERLLKFGFGPARIEVAREYGFPLTPEGRKNSFNILTDNILSAAIMASQKGDIAEAGISIQALSRLTKIIKDLNIDYDIEQEEISNNLLKMIHVKGINSRTG